MKRKELVKKVAQKLSNFKMDDFLKLQKSKDLPDFTLKDYITKEYGERANQFLVWVLGEINEKNKRIMLLEAKWSVEEIKKLKGEFFVKNYVSEDILRNLL